MPLFKPGPESDKDRGDKFRWLARTGIGVRFGSRPIGWYQAHQMCALQVIEERAARALRLQKWATKDGMLMISEPFEVKVQAADREYRHRYVVARRMGGGSKDWASVGTTLELFDAADRCARR
jgi:hypothetical protein